MSVGLADHGTEVELQVADDGPGVPEELQSEIFDRFVRSDDGRARTAGGTGLGLAITHAVAAAHHGRVELDSRPGRTVFRVTVPRGREPDGSAAAPDDSAVLRAGGGRGA